MEISYLLLLIGRLQRSRVAQLHCFTIVSPPELASLEMSNTDEPELITTSQPPENWHRKKCPLSVSPTKRQDQPSDLPGECCIKCEIELGVESKLIQCDLCGSWIHPQCKNVSDEVYENILGNFNNIVHYCDTNNCISRTKQLLFDFSTANTKIYLI